MDSHVDNQPRRRLFATTLRTSVGTRATTAVLISVLIVAAVGVGLHTTGNTDLLRVAVHRLSVPPRSVDRALAPPSQHTLVPCPAPLNPPPTSNTFGLHNFTADAEALRRGLVTLGDGHRLRRFTHKLLSGQPVSIVIVGGSVAAGQGAVHGNSFATRFYRWVQQAFPHQDHRLHNAGIGGTNSMTFAACIGVLVADADLAIVEFTMNDFELSVPMRTNSEAFTIYTPGLKPEDPRSGGSLKSYERLLRVLLQLPSRPAVVLLHYFSWFVSGGGGGKVAPFYNSMEVEYTSVGGYYSLPQLSVRNAFYPLMLEDRPGYQARVWRAQHENSTSEEDLFYYDMTAAEDVTARPLNPADEAAAALPLPIPMVPGNYERTGLACMMGPALEHAVAERRGFEFVVESKNKWGWVATDPGSELVLKIDTRSQYGMLKSPLDGGAATAPPPPPADGAAVEVPSVQLELMVNYLSSYEHMGRFRLACRGGCSCEEVELEGHWEHRFSQSRPSDRLHVTEHAECLVAVTVLEGTSSGEHKVKVTGLMLVEQGTPPMPAEILEITQNEMAG